jgi:predicted Zn-ribbon and HTH transcriptional regulator
MEFSRVRLTKRSCRHARAVTICARPTASAARACGIAQVVRQNALRSREYQAGTLSGLRLQPGRRCGVRSLPGVRKPASSRRTSEPIAIVVHRDLAADLRCSPARAHRLGANLVLPARCRSCRFRFRRVGLSLELAAALALTSLRPPCQGSASIRSRRRNRRRSASFRSDCAVGRRAHPPPGAGVSSPGRGYGLLHDGRGGRGLDGRPVAGVASPDVRLGSALIPSRPASA